MAAGQFSQFLTIFFVGIILLSASISWLQIGRVWVPGAVLPDFRRIAPERGLMKIGAGFASLPGAVLKGGVALSGMMIVFWYRVESLFSYRGYSFIEQQTFLSSDLQWILKITAAGFLGFGIVDLFMRRRQFRQQVYMNHEQMKRDHRESEGDPHIKAQRRALHQALAREEIIRQVKKSRVILVQRAIPAGGQ